MSLTGTDLKVARKKAALAWLEGYKTFNDKIDTLSVELVEDRTRFAAQGGAVPSSLQDISVERLEDLHGFLVCTLCFYRIFPD